MPGDPQDANDWSIFKDLVSLHTEQAARPDGAPASISGFRESGAQAGSRPRGESYLQRVLRPYDEAGAQKDDQKVTEIRTRLDEALHRLTLLEIERQLGLPETVLSADVVGHLHTLFGSDAFLHYVNTYLYFAVRFLPDAQGVGQVTPGRESIAGKSPRPQSAGDQEEPECDDGNVKSFPLKPPPPLGKNAKSSEFYAKLLQGLKELEEQPLVLEALQFLDTDHGSACPEDPYEWGDAKAFELWLRGLYLDAKEKTIARYERIREGLKIWAKNRSDFYRGNFAAASGKARPCKTEILEVSDPMVARLALIDLYWIARLLRAEVSSIGWVRYQKSNWLHLLQFNTLLADAKQENKQEQQEDSQKQLRNAEITLRSVFDLVMDLVQNSVEVTNTPGHQGRPGTTYSWREAFDEELDEIVRQRHVRTFPDLSPAPPPSPPPSSTEEENSADSDKKRPEKGWSKKLLGILGHEFPDDRVGLAFSGGGIRSATLNLGVLQGLMELDFLRHFDYLSTVSGGGFIGSWLVGNVRRSRHWLGRNTDWSESIRHLRKYSNYLAPRTGILSADTWNLGNSWLRNTFLIQLTGIVWLFVLLLSAIVSMRLFLYAGEPFKRVPSTAALAAILGALVFAATVSYYLDSNTAETGAKSPTFWRKFFAFITYAIGFLGGLTLFCWTRISETFGKLVAYFTGKDTVAPDHEKLRDYSEGVRHRLQGGDYAVRISAVAAWIAAWAIASLFWFHAPMYSVEWQSLYNVRHYSEILEYAWSDWKLLLVLSCGGVWILSYFTLERRRPLAPVVAVLCTLVLYLELAGIFYCFRVLRPVGDVANSVVFIIGPAMVLLAFAVCILLLIGFTGRNALEAQREWWTRFGTWLGIVGGIIAFVSSVALIGPWLILKLLDPRGHSSLVKSIQWTSILSWLGTVIGGTLAGKSSKTSGSAGETSSPKLELLAAVGGFLFIVGSFLLGSTLLYILLFEIFGPDYAVAGSNALHIFCELALSQLSLALAAVVSLGVAFSWFFEVNIFGFSQYYRNRIVRCYLGATRWGSRKRHPNAFTKLDPLDDMGLWRFRTDSPGVELPWQPPRPTGKGKAPDDPPLDQSDQPSTCKESAPYRGPFPVLCCTLNLGGSSDLSVNTRHGDSFTLTPLRCGSNRANVGYAPTVDSADGLIKGGYADGIQLGQAVAVSGAAVSPNMGYNTSPLVAFLLTMFNVRLGWWFPNPGRYDWKKRGLSFSLYYLAAELFGLASDTRNYVNVCDGGNFENLAIYELVRRRCKLIIACDAECDEQMQFGGLGKMIRLCETDFGAIIDLDVSLIRPLPGGDSRTHAAVGLIKYCTGEVGYLIYLKASITGDESVSIAQYRSTHPAFPHESTADQFYSEDQFESYRTLGLHMVRKSFQGIAPGEDPLTAAERLYDILAPAGPPTEKFLQHAKSVIDLWEKFRNSKRLLDFMRELVTVANHPQPKTADIPADELCIGLELIQIMEDVFLDLRLDDLWDHPDNRGWAILFMRWARSPRLRRIWKTTHRTFGIRFEYFCNARLGLTRDVPIVRV